MADLDDYEILQREEFLSLIRSGVGPLNAAVEVGWTPAKLRSLMKEPSFAEMVDACLEQLYESVEETVFKLAKNGNMSAAQMVLYNRRPDRWRDVKRIEVDQKTTVSIELASATRDAALALLEQRSIGELQPGGALDEIVVEEDDE